MLSAESQTWRLSLNSVTVKTVTFITLCYLSLNRVFAEAPKIRRVHTANTMVTTWHGKSRSLRLPHRLASIVIRVIQSILTTNQAEMLPWIKPRIKPGAYSLKIAVGFF